MASNAISSQGAILQMGTGTGGAVTCTAGAAGNPTILTKAAHGLTNGTVVTLAAFSGADAATLNGKTVAVSNVTSGTFAVPIDSTGKTITYTGTATPVTYTAIGEFKSWTGPNSNSDELDTTNLASTAKEKLLGLTDYGDFSFDISVYLDDVGQTALRTALDAKTLKTFKIILPSGTLTTGTFSAYVKSMPVKGGVGQILGGTVTLSITGAFTWS